MAKVMVRSFEKYQQRIVSRGHELSADEPVELGGDDTGSSPYELLLAALGACMSMTIRMYAERKEWPLEGVEVTLDHDRIHAQDCVECETKEGRIDQIRKKIVIRGDLSDDQVERFLEIARKCPVNRTLLGEIRMVDEITRAI